MIKGVLSLRMQALILPVGVIKKFERIFRSFLWSGAIDSRRSFFLLSQELISPLMKEA